MSSAAVGTHHSGAGPLSLMSCVRESSPLQDYEQDNEKIAVTKRRFWNPKKWFRRKNKVSEDVVNQGGVEIVDKDGNVRSRSTSELSITDDQIRRRSGSSMHPGLSVSHDSVFHSPNSGSDMELENAQSSSSLSILQPNLRLQTELSERLRLRRGRGDTSEDDEGLPHSPCNSPTTTDGLLLDKTAIIIKDLPVAKSHSTCSDGSLLSMGSSEMDEDLFGQQSRHSSKQSLLDKDLDLDLSSSSQAVPLNHSAAHHRVSVRPNKRRAPHRNKNQLSAALPTTPEVNEDSSTRGLTVENSSIKESVTTSTKQITTSTKQITTAQSRSTLTTHVTTETQLKCSSLPPGLDPQSLFTSPLASGKSSGGSGKNNNNPLTRSRSNAGTKDSEGERFAILQEAEESGEDKERSFFERIFPRRSSGPKKKKIDSGGAERCTEEGDCIKAKRRGASKPIVAPRGAANRQRIQPIDLPPSPEGGGKVGTSPLQIELENRFKRSLPPLPPHTTPPHSPKFELFTSVTMATATEDRTSTSTKSSNIKLPGLSSLQQKVLTLNSEDEDECFKSLTTMAPSNGDEFKVKVAKSHSFSRSDSLKNKTQQAENTYVISHAQQRHSQLMAKKASSLDSVDHPTSDVAGSKLPSLRHGDAITISGPSHTTVKTVSMASSVVRKVSKESVSVTKIHLKRDKDADVVDLIPEFLSRRQLNKVETKPISNVVFSTTNGGTPVMTHRVSHQQDSPRKFSQEDLGIAEKKEEDEDEGTQLTPGNMRFKKNEHNRKKSIPDSPKPTPEKPFLRSRSISLDSLKSSLGSELIESSCSGAEKSSQDSLDVLNSSDTETNNNSPNKNARGSIVETVVMRRKSVQSHNKEDEPELMKVFARRSLKLKDTESESITEQIIMQGEKEEEIKERDSSDKENSPMELRKKSEVIITNFSNNNNRVESQELVLKDHTQYVETTEVTLRKTSGNSIKSSSGDKIGYQRVKSDDKIVKSSVKKSSFVERRRNTTDNWIVAPEKEKQDEIMKSDNSDDDEKKQVVTEAKNFNQRKAEWEKRAQEAQKKSAP